MADAKKPANPILNGPSAVKAPARESAARPPSAASKELVKGKSEIVPSDAKQLQQWFKQMSDKESAAHMGQESVSPGLTSEEDILEAIARDLGMEKIHLAEVAFTPELIAEIPPKVVKKFRVVPVRFTENDLWVALSDPHNVQCLDDLSRILNKSVHGMVSLEDEIDRVIHRFYETEDYSKVYEDLTEDETPTAQYAKYDELNLEGAAEAEQPLVVKFVDLIFRQAVHDRASDIHVEPHRRGVTIRFRVDGVLHEVPSPPRKWQNSIISRLKVLSNMDLAEKRVPLDGRIRLTMAEKKLDLRVSSLPTIFGESIVMRILDQSQVMMGLEDVGFLPNSIRLFQELIRSPNGVILMTGPTGSGKTTTLYAALGVLNTPENKIVTLEDPVEYQIPGINQIQINTEIGLGFPQGLRSVLRQSPDVILVGEIRDLETAENAIRAALTGHLVFSTLHTNDAPSSTVRLIDMGIKPYLVASSLQAAIAQRLVRRVCQSCKQAFKAPPEAITEMGYDPEEYAEHEFFEGQGCDRCSKSGYRGRTAIHEIMVMDADLRRRVIRSEPATRIKRAAMAKGMISLRMDGWQKCLLGQTSIEEVMRVTQGDL
jgi:type II secretory ATPase GspE/PulE/Tfp pilus assembly ATPase PilB-like protein